MNLTVEEYLRSKNLTVFRAGSGQLTTQCVFHDDMSPKGKLYINAENGAFDCKAGSCGEQGGFRRLMEHFGDQMEESSPQYRPSRKLSILTEYATLAHEALWNNPKAVQYLLDRGLSEDTIREAMLGFHARGVGLMGSLPSAGREGGFTRAELEETGLLYASGKEFLEGRITIPYMAHRQVVQVRGKDMLGKYVTPAGEEVKLYGADDLAGRDTALLTEGEFDALIVRASLRSSPDVKARNIAVVGLAGTQALPGGKEGFVKLFDDMKRVYIGFDSDEAGRRGALKVKELLGPKARILELPEEGLDWNDWMGPQAPHRPHGGHGWRDAMDLISAADMRDKRVYTVSEAARQLREIETAAPALKLGYPSLDALIAPGLRPGSVTVPLARTGNGKSVFLQNICYYTRHIPSMFVTLELTAAETWIRLRRIARFHHPGMTDEEIEGLFPNLRIVDENNLRMGDMVQLVEEFIEDYGEPPQIAHVDYLGYYARGQLGTGPYEKVSNAIMSLKEWAKMFRMAVISPGQVNRGTKPGEPISEDSARDAGPVEETADFLFGIWRPWESAELQSATRPGTVQDSLKLKILKSRHGNKGRVVDLAMGHHSLAIVDTYDSKGRHRIAMENASYNTGSTYDDYWKAERQKAYAAMQVPMDMKEEKAPWE